jgi:hypothetical protein
MRISKVGKSDFIPGGRTMRIIAAQQKGHSKLGPRGTGRERDTTAFTARTAGF